MAQPRILSLRNTHGGCFALFRRDQGRSRFVRLLPFQSLSCSEPKDKLMEARQRGVKYSPKDTGRRMVHKSHQGYRVAKFFFPTLRLLELQAFVASSISWIFRSLCYEMELEKELCKSKKLCVKDFLTFWPSSTWSFPRRTSKLRGDCECWIEGQYLLGMKT